MKILIACEKSGIVRDAFRALGWDAWSCDIQPTDMPGQHIQGYLEDAIGSGREWDLIIAHPPCTFTCVSGIHWNGRRQGRQQETDKAVYFANMIWQRDCPRIGIEQPISILSRQPTGDMPYLGQPTQYIQPYDFGEDASKKTSLWLKGLPPLVNTLHVPGRLVICNGKTVERWSNQTDSGQNKLAPSEHRADDRSRTYPGIARAMAEQWTAFIQKGRQSHGW